MIWNHLRKEKSAFVLFGIIICAGLFALDFFYRSTAQVSFKSFVAAHQESALSENYYKIVLSTRQLKKLKQIFVLLLFIFVELRSQAQVNGLIILNSLVLQASKGLVFLPIA